MWIVTAVAFAFVILRAYTRIKVVQSYGVDDHVYNFAFVSLGFHGPRIHLKGSC